MNCRTAKIWSKIRNGETWYRDDFTTATSKVVCNQLVTHVVAGQICISSE